MSDTGLPPEATPPPPDVLKQRLGRIEPVRMRRPWLAFVVVALASLAWGALGFAVHPVRADLPWLPSSWLVLAGAVWLAGFAWALRRALVPTRGQVLPDGRAAERVALSIALGVAAFTALYTRSAPGHSRVPEDFVVVTWHCLRFTLLADAGVIAIALVALRRMRPLLSWRIGAAVGAAGGALGGLALHFLCPYATWQHVTAGHAAGVAVGALLGAAVARLVSR